MSTSAARSALPPHAQFLRFALVGCAGFIVDAAVLSAAIQLFDADRYLGRVVSYLAAATFTWAFNRNYTFRAQRDDRLLREWGRFLASNAVGGLVNYLTYAMLVSVSALVSAHPVIGVGAGSLAGLVVNFSLSRRLVFAHAREGEREASISDSRIGWGIALLALISVAATVGLTVNPWPRDGWYQTQYFLFGSFPGYDDYTPIAAPALLYRGAHLIALRLGYDLAGEFYVASILQNLLLLLSACFMYYALRLMRMRGLAALLAIGFLLFVLSTGLPQAFYSENVALFLMSAVMLALAAVRSDDSNAKFWALAITCGVVIGLLVVTRMTPVFLIPGIALLFFRRMPPRRVVQFTGTLCLITALMVVGTMIGNHARFGRYELTNSSGRHLWQGVTGMADAALADSDDYRRLRQINPHTQGLNWWEIPPGGHFTLADPREPLLAKLSKQAIANAPARYAFEGGKKFATTIGAAPYRLGYGRGEGHWNPLERTDLLPALSREIHGSTYGSVVERVFGRLYELFRWLYPITIFAIALTGVAMLAERVNWKITRGSPARWSLPVAVFVVLGLPLAAIPLLTSMPKLEAVLGSVVSAALLVAGASVLHTTLRRGESTRSTFAAPGLPYFGFLALMFFGSLWFSWQIEMANSRNTIPFLPLWLLMLALSITYWKALVFVAHERRC